MSYPFSPDNNAIDRTVLAEEDGGSALACLDSVRQRKRNSKRRNSAAPAESAPALDAVAVAPIKKVKTEGERKPIPAKPMDGEVEILNNFSTSTIHSPQEDISNNKSESGTTSDEIAVVGTRHQVRLPHARQHCTEKPFLTVNDGADGAWNVEERRVINMEFCDCCYCYVCDIPAKDCQGNWNDDHCLATDQGVDKTYWDTRRADVQKNGIAASAYEAAHAPREQHFRHECVDNEFLKDADCRWDFSKKKWYSFSLRDQKRVRNKGSNNSSCPHCHCYLCDIPASQCDKWNGIHSSYSNRHCNAYPDSDHWDTMKHGYGPFPPGHAFLKIHKSSKTCQHCQWYSRPYSGYSFLSDSIQHDLCQACGRVADAKNLNKSQVLAHELTPDDIFLGTKKIEFTLCPADPRELKSYANRWKEKAGEPGWIYDPNAYTSEVFHHRLGLRPSLDRIVSSVKEDIENRTVQSDAYHFYRIIILKNPADYAMMKELNFISSTSHSGPNGFSVDIQASLENSALSSGVFELSVYVKADSKAQDTPTAIARFLGLWFGVLPFKLSDICLNLRATQTLTIETDEINSSVDTYRQNLSLKPGTGSDLIGGTCASATYATNFQATLKQYFKEILPQCIFEHSTTVRNGFIFDSVLSPQDHKIAVAMKSNAFELWQETSSLKGLMDNLENRGHPAALFVEGLNVELLPFQSQSLQWAVERETIPGGIQSFSWTTLPEIEPAVYFNPILACLSKTKPNLVRGGIIAEQMGLGKTIISLSLILKNPAPDLPESGLASSITAQLNLAPGAPFWDPDMYQRTSAEKQGKRGQIASRGTLVVCNVSLVGQWIEEAKQKLTNPGLVYPYHGPGRSRDPKKLATAAIVVTTYETLASDATFHSKKSNDLDYVSPCEAVRWWRVIADESHVLRNAGTAKCTAVMNLIADNKWLVSGTPINTTVNDLKNQMKFLGIQHSSAIMEIFRCSFFCGIRDPSTRRDMKNLEIPGRGAFNFLMRNIMMRHSQAQKYTGTDTTLMSLPPKTERVVTVKFSEQEKQEYATLESVARTFYENLVKSRKNIGKNYLLLTSQLVPLRVACAGGKVPLDDMSGEESDDEEPDGDVPKKRKKVKKFSDFAFTSKLKVLIAELETVRTKDPTAKCLVFSQYTSTLKWLQEELPKHGFQHRTLSGDMTMRNRAMALRDFQNDPPTTIFLLSMRAGAVGINLTQANNVFLMEPCFNAAVTAQAVGRVYRLGQKRPVSIAHLVMEDSIETRIRLILEKKYGSVNASVALDDGEDKKPAAAAVVGCIVSDKAQVMANEFDLLFGVNEEGWYGEDLTASNATTAMPDHVASVATPSDDLDDCDGDRNGDNKTQCALL